MLPIVLLAKFLDSNKKYVTGFIVLCSFVAWLVGFIQSAITSVIATFAGIFSALNLDSFGSVDFSGLEFIGYVNAFIPLSEFVGLLTIFLVAWGAVILLRWVKSFVPTIGN